MMCNEKNRTMKKLIYIAMTLVVLLAGQKVQAENFEKVLIKDKVFAFDASKVLKIKTQHGSVKIITWEKPQVKVTVEVEGAMKKQKELNEIINKAKVNFENGGWTISTGFEEKVVIKNGFVDFKTTVYAPKNICVDLDMAFVDTWLESIASTSKIKGKFNTFYLGDCVGTTPLKMEFAFADNIKIGRVPNLDVKIRNSTMSIESVDEINLNSAFSDVDIEEEMQKMILNSRNDDIELETVKEFVSEKINFTDLFIEKLEKNLHLENVKMGELKVREVAGGFDNIDVGAQFSSVKLGLKDVSYKFELDIKYGDVSVPIDAKIEVKNESRGSKYVKGYKGQKGGKVKVGGHSVDVVIK